MGEKVLASVFVAHGNLRGVIGSYNTWWGVGRCFEGVVYGQDFNTSRDLIPKLSIAIVKIVGSRNCPNRF